MQNQKKDSIKRNKRVQAECKNFMGNRMRLDLRFLQWCCGGIFRTYLENYLHFRN